MNEVRIEALGDCALLIRFGDRIDAATSSHTLAVAKALSEANLSGLVDIAPAYASICVRYDPTAWVDPLGAQSPYSRIAAQLHSLVGDLQVSPAPPTSALIEIPVYYGGEFGPDLEQLARHAQLPVDEVVTRHCAAEYRVAMLGFAPGFPYLLGLDPALHAPRRASPRIRVPAGSVAIGGAQTGIYPRESPGGWQIIGRTPLCLFDATRATPALLNPGQRLRFRAIVAAEFTNHAP
jgi:KipI family sensor histidine kinase inhibitor